MPSTLSIKITTAAVVVTTGVGLVLAPAAEASTAPAQRGTTHLHASRAHTVSVASTLRPGLVHLHNDGRRPIVVIRKKHDGIDKLVRLSNSERESDEKKAFKLYTPVAGLDSHSDSYVRLARGTYFLFDGSADKIKASKIRTVNVRGKTSNAVRPTTTRNITITKAGTLTGATTGGIHPFVRLRNSGSNPHAIILMKVAAKATDADVDAAVASRSVEKLFAVIDEDSFFGSVLVAYPHQDVTTKVDLGRARYLVVTDAALANGSTFGAGTVRELTLR